MRHSILYTGILCAVAIAANAQSSTPSLPTPIETISPAILDFAPPSDVVGMISQFAKKRIIVVTDASRPKRTSCLVENVSAGELVCAAGHFHGRRRFRTGEIAALIEPAQRYHTWLLFTGWLGTGAGLITEACFLASVTIVGAIPVALIGGLFVLSSPLAAMASDDDTPERLLYARSGFSVSSIKLH